MFPIRILYIINSVNIGGAETTLLNLIDGLNRSHFEIFLYISGKSPLAGEARSRGCQVREIGTYTGKTDIRFLLNLAQLVREVNPDVIHSHIWFTNLYASVCGKLLGVPVVSTFHSNHLVESLFERLSLRTIYHLSDRVVMVSNYQIRHFGFSNSMPKINVIPNGVRIPQLKKMGGHEILEIKTRQLGVDSEDKIITYVSNLRPVKGHIFLLQGIRLVLREYKNIKLLLIGDGPLRDELVKKCEEYNIKDKVRFLGFRDDVMNLLSVTDVFVHPSLSEANSIAIMEAMAAGLPVIATDVGGNSEIINNNETGLLVPPMDSQALADNILLLLGDENLGLELGRKGMRRVEDEYSLERMVHQYENLYFDIFDKGLYKTDLSGRNGYAGKF